MTWIGKDRTGAAGEKQLVLSLVEDQQRGEWIRRQCTVQRFDGGHPVSEQVLWYEYQIDRASIELPPNRDADSFVTALVLDAMREDRRLVVRGSVCRTLLSNLTEFQEAWHKWIPNYHVQPIAVDEVREPSDVLARPAGAVCAFSGGVDATFSVWRHSQRLCGWRSQGIPACAMVHGFDIPLNDQAAFDRTSDRARMTLRELGIPLILIRTNYRQLSQANWEHSCALALVAALSHLKRIASTCLIGSSEPYDSLVIPWGSSPITDHLLGSAEFGVLHDGAAYSRTEKVREISNWATGSNNLRVCWEGEIRDKNCGQCEKCVRTILNFLACEKEVPACFPSGIDLGRSLKQVRLRSSAARAEWKQLLSYAQSHGVRGAWMQDVRRIVAEQGSAKRRFSVSAIRRLVARAGASLRGRTRH